MYTNENRTALLKTLYKNASIAIIISLFKTILAATNVFVMKFTLNL